jgi:hypothetical protein
MFGPFYVLSFEGDLPDMLYLEWSEDVVVGDDPRISDYQDNFERLLVDALTPEASIDFILSQAEEMMA